MTTYNLKRFSNAEALKAIGREYLLALLIPYASYFKDRGLTLPPQSSPDGLDYEQLVQVLMNPGNDTPDSLSNSLFYVHEMSTPECMDVLLQAAEEKNISIDGNSDPTPADVAAQIYLKDKDLLERKHAEQEVSTRRSFEYFGTELYPLPEFNPPTQQSLVALQTDLDDWFERKKRGRGSRVFVFPRKDAVWFMIRHGDPYKREGIFEGKEPVAFFQPEKYDVLVYDPSIGDIRMNACSKGEKDLYRRKFGLHVFGNEDFFTVRKKYTLEPLRKGDASIACEDVTGMESVTLKQIHFYLGGAQREVEIRQANDVYAALKARQRDMPAKLPIIKASFEVKFTDSKKKRSVIVGASFANYTRDSDSAVVKDWLDKREFTLDRRSVN
ncbi:MAG: hypothetical protein A2Z40_04405 [Deltaproteobacteria bacterium RBG_19FT_COMBO_60_16]|nr:MAG: hypothetical protein A2Z40_04405 [Deltaproteobacteria bacterium RBG_19FT_COMBO_60_16]